MTEAFIGARQAGKTWALCAWQQEEPESRVIVASTLGRAGETFAMLVSHFGHPDVPYVEQQAIITVMELCEQAHGDREYVIDEIGECARKLFGTRLAGFTASGFNADDQASFLRALMVPGG